MLVAIVIIGISVFIVIPISLFAFLLVNGTGWIYDKIKGVGNEKS